MRTILTTISIMLCALLSAQNNYYTEEKTFYENGYTYRCDIRSSRITTLYNTNNQWTYTEQVYTATGKTYAPSRGEWIPLTERDSWTGDKVRSIVFNALSASERERVKGSGVTIRIFIDPQTGKISEVNFGFHVTNAYATIPVSVYRKIETDLKAQVWYTPTVEGEKLNYIRHSWRYEVP